MSESNRRYPVRVDVRLTVEERDYLSQRSREARHEPPGHADASCVDRHEGLLILCLLTSLLLSPRGVMPLIAR